MTKKKIIKLLIQNVEYLYKLEIREIFLNKKENSEAAKERQFDYTKVLSVLFHFKP